MESCNHKLKEDGDYWVCNLCGKLFTLQRPSAIGAMMGRADRFVEVEIKERIKK